MPYRIIVAVWRSLAVVPLPGAGKDLVVGFTGDATSLNPVVATDGQSYIAEWPIFDSLVELDDKLNIRPLLAESWDVSKDGLTYTFKLKKGVKWHDGKPFTARDVAFTFYSVLDPKVTTPHRAYFDMLASFPELDEQGQPEEARGAGRQADRGRRRPHGPLPPALSLGRVPGRAGEPAGRRRPRARAQGPGPEHRRVQPEAGRDRPLQVRRVAARRADRAGGQRAVPRGPSGAEPRDLPHHPRRGRPAPGAAGRRCRLHRAAAPDRSRPTQADARAPGPGHRQHRVHLFRLAAGHRRPSTTRGSGGRSTTRSTSRRS